MKQSFYFYFALSSVILTYSLYLFCDKESIFMIQQENGLYENIGALSLFLASALCFACYMKDENGNNFKFLKTRRNLFFLCLSGMFFFGFGEEINWGQSIFNWPTPQFMMGDGTHFYNNLQHETNIHNLAIFNGIDQHHERKSFWKLIFNIDRLFSVFWLTYFIIIPLMYKENSRFYLWVKKINLPVLPIYIGIFFLFTYLISNTLKHYGFSFASEIKETNLEVLVLIASLYFFQKILEYNAQIQQEESVQEGNIIKFKNISQEPEDSQDLMV